VSKNTVMWKGDKFIAKTMNLTRINLANLRNSKEFRESSVKVNYTNTILYLNLNIKENLGSQFVDEIFQVKTKLRGMKYSATILTICFIINYFCINRFISESGKTEMLPIW